MIKRKSKNQPKINQNQPKIDQNSTKNRGLEGSGAGLEASWAGLGDPRRLESYLGPFWNRLGGLLGGLGPRKVANMGPTWHPKRSKNQLKIEVWKALGQVWRRIWPAWAIQGILRVIFGRFGGVLEASWAVLGRERWSTWDQHGVQNGANID